MINLHWADLKGFIEGFLDRSGGLVRLSLEHHMIHNSKAFVTSNLYQGDNEYYMLIRPQKVTHLKQIEVTPNIAEVIVNLYRNPTYTAEGEEIDVVISNDMTESEVPAQFFVGTTITELGTLIPGQDVYLPGSAGGGPTAATNNTGTQDWEFILNPENEYLYHISLLEGEDNFNCDIKLRNYFVGD